MIQELAAPNNEGEDEFFDTRYRRHLSIVVTVISIVVGVISLMPKREDPKIEKPTNANNIAVTNSPKEQLYPSDERLFALPYLFAS